MAVNMNTRNECHVGAVKKSASGNFQHSTMWYTVFWLGLHPPSMR